MYVCMLLCMLVCIYVCVCVWVSLCVCIYIRTYIYILYVLYIWGILLCYGGGGGGTTVVSVYSICILYMFCFSMIFCNKIFLYKNTTTDSLTLSSSSASLRTLPVRLRSAMTTFCRNMFISILSLPFFTMRRRAVCSLPTASITTS